MKSAVLTDGCQSMLSLPPQSECHSKSWGLFESIFPSSPLPKPLLSHVLLAQPSQNAPYVRSSIVSVQKTKHGNTCMQGKITATFVTNNNINRLQSVTRITIIQFIQIGNQHIQDSQLFLVSTSTTTVWKTYQYRLKNNFIHPWIILKRRNLILNFTSVVNVISLSTIVFKII